jgi:hypothetical protein
MKNMEYKMMVEKKGDENNMYKMTTEKFTSKQHIEVKAFNKFQIAHVVKIYTENLVPQNEPLMLNIIGRLQNLRRNPINVDITLVLKRCNLGLNHFSNYVKKDQQLKMTKFKKNKQKNLKIYLCPERSFVNPVLKDFLTERNS